jgi:hypothetical protein
MTLSRIFLGLMAVWLSLTASSSAEFGPHSQSEGIDQHPTEHYFTSFGIRCRPLGWNQNFNCQPTVVQATCCPIEDQHSEIEICGLQEPEEIHVDSPPPPSGIIGNLAGPWRLDIAPTGHSRGGLFSDAWNVSRGNGSGWSTENIASGGGFGGVGGGGIGGGRRFPMLPENSGNPTPGEHVTPMPEPSSLLLMLTGASGVTLAGAWRRRRASSRSDAG